MPLPCSLPALNIRLFKLSQHTSLPHEKSPYDLSTSMVTSKANIVNLVEEIKLNSHSPSTPVPSSSNVMTMSNDRRFSELAGKSCPPQVSDYLPPA